MFLATFPLAWSDVGWRALWPSLIALTVVLLARRVLTGLLIGGLAGCLLLTAGNPGTAFTTLFTDHLIPSLQSSWNLAAILFTLVLGGFAALLERGGSLETAARRYLQRNASRRLPWGAFGLGIICFFDGLANSMLVGRVFRGLADRVGVTRVKLAYIVDTTSSAVACVAFVSTWIAYQLSMIQKGYELAGRAEEANPYGLFFASIPYNFYCLLALVLLVVVLARQWDIGPMAKALPGDPEAKTNSGNNTPDKASSKTTTPDQLIGGQPPQASAAAGSPGLWRALIPLIFLVTALPLGLYLSGSNNPWPLTWTKAAEAFGQADAATVLILSSVLAALVAFACYPHEKAKTSATEAFQGGVLSLVPPVAILLGAWILSSTLGELGAAGVLSGMLGDRLPVSLLPTAVFLTGMAISFTTGTSWGTMGILMPLALPVAFELGGAAGLDAPAQQTLLAAIVGAVFSGAVFGDHASPMSDTTIVSSIATGIEPREHVRTQLPYAMITATVAFVLGFLPAGWGLPAWVSLLAGAAVLIALPILWPQGKKSPNPA